jgi:aldose 1-epimerase
MSESSIGKVPFGKTPDGHPVELYTLRNHSGMEAGILTFGGIVAFLKTPDRKGDFDDVVLGYDSLDSYIRDEAHFGGIIGRYGNRIAKGRFRLNGSVYSLAVNNGDNHLHGGLKGFDKVIWKAHPLEIPEGPVLQLSYLSKDGEEGFPGNLSVIAAYTLTNDNALRLDITARTDKDTICNLTNHSYFNFLGQGDVLDYLVQIDAGKFTPTDAGNIPTGELHSVAGTPFDFRRPTAIGARIDSDDQQIRIGNGYDKNYVFDKLPGQLGLVARVSEKTSGRVMEVWTTEPGMQFYTANFLGNGMVGKGGQKYQPRHAFCMEPQHFPDSPNHSHFPSVTLKPGETYRNTIIYKFSTE